MKKTNNDDLLLAANTIRVLSMDAVQKANSGHPGLPMGMADVASVLFMDHIIHNPIDPKWPNRDRFVLSGGHGSMLIYSVLHLTGYDLPLDEIRNFRQWGSKTPGHPEFGHTVGVETTTGPLGQGIANAVGMALAERMLAERLNTAEMSPVDHSTFCFCGDGDLMEGISHEACSIAGHLGLNKLILFYDDNSITIEGSTNITCADDVKKRFQAYNWNVIAIDGHDFDQIQKAISKAKREKTRPTIIICKTTIAKGSPKKAGSASAHGEPLGADEIKATKKNIGMPEDKDFYVPEKVRELFAGRLAALKRMQSKWEKNQKKYREANPELAKQWDHYFKQDLPENMESLMPVFPVDKPIATRAASGKVIQELSKAFQWLVGGAADLAPSTKTLIESAKSVSAGAFCGRNLHFGIREHAMAAICNGMTLHGGFRVYASTFFVFSDYCRPSVRLSALMNLPVIYVFTHDSFHVGEDGPTHEPIEHLAALRCIPNVTVIRPADATETSAAWITALKNAKGPTAICLTRQNLSIIDRSKMPAAANLEKGAYTLWQSADGTPALTILASGSEVEIALQAGKTLAGECIVRVVSMPSWELFNRQPESYRNSVIPAAGLKVAIEAGCSMGWSRYIGNDGLALCIDHFGASAPAKVLAEKFGFTTGSVVSNIRNRLKK